jgi:hypothetical protein
MTWTTQPISRTCEHRDEHDIPCGAPVAFGQGQPCARSAAAEVPKMDASANGFWWIRRSGQWLPACVTAIPPDKREDHWCLRVSYGNSVMIINFQETVNEQHWGGRIREPSHDGLDECQALAAQAVRLQATIDALTKERDDFCNRFRESVKAHNETLRKLEAANAELRAIHDP